MPTKSKINVLIVDDSAAIRQLLKTILSSDPEIDVIGVATDPFDAREKIKKLNPDVLTLDVEMPRMDGLTFLEKLMKGHPMPVVMVSTLTQKGADITLKALEIGAVDFVAKPTLDTLRGVDEAKEEIVAKVKTAAKAKIRGSTSAKAVSPPTIAVNSFKLTHQLIAIGASTGGTEAIKDVLIRFPSNAPATLIVQHMPPGFTASFAARLDGLCQVRVKEAEDGDRAVPGQVLIAPGDHHMEIVRSGAEYRVRVFQAPPVNRHRPSVDVLFDSFARNVGCNAVAAILTGMGADGAEGLKRMRDAGAWTVAQDESTCVVFGMPKAAIQLHGVDEIKPLDHIASALLTHVQLEKAS